MCEGGYTCASGVITLRRQSVGAAGCWPHDHSQDLCQAGLPGRVPGQARGGPKHQHQVRVRKAPCGWGGGVGDCSCVFSSFLLPWRIIMQRLFLDIRCSGERETPTEKMKGSREHDLRPPPPTFQAATDERRVDVIDSQLVLQHRLTESGRHGNQVLSPIFRRE